MIENNVIPQQIKFEVVILLVHESVHSFVRVCGFLDDN